MAYYIIVNENNNNNYNKYNLFTDRKIMIIMKVAVHNSNKNKNNFGKSHTRGLNICCIIM